MLCQLSLRRCTCANKVALELRLLDSGHGGPLPFALGIRQTAPLSEMGSRSGND